MTKPRMGENLKRWCQQGLAALLAVSLISSMSVAQTQTIPSTGMDAQVNRQKAIHLKIQQIQNRYPNQNIWLRGGHLNQTFQRSSSQFNVYSFLTERQKALLRQDIAKVDQAMEERLKKLGNNSVSKPNTLTEVGRTYIMIYLLAVIAIAKDDIQKSQVEARALNPAETGKKWMEAIAEIVNSGEIMTSILAAGVTHKAFKVPLDAVHKMISDAKIGPIFKNLLITMAHTLVSFTGWEFGAQLWKEATNMLDFQDLSETERKFLSDRNKILSQVWRALKSQNPAAGPDREMYKAADRILCLTISNVMKIIFVEGDLRLQWIYNAIRLRIATGHFVTLVSAMVSASTLGTTIAPGAGTLFGLAGGVATLFIPERHKNSITYSIKEKWLSVLESFGGGTTYAWLKAGFDENGNSKHLNSMPLDQVLTDRATYRQKVVDVYLERVYQSYMGLRADSEKMKTTKMPASPGERGKYNEEMAHLNSESQIHFRLLLTSLKNLISFYMSEASFMDSMKMKSSAEKVKKIFENESINNENLLAHFCTFADSIVLLDEQEMKAHTPEMKAEGEAIARMCKAPFNSSSRSYEEMPQGVKANYDSAVKFLEKTIWTRFDEQVLSLDRLDEILLVR